MLKQGKRGGEVSIPTASNLFRNGEGQSSRSNSNHHRLEEGMNRTGIRTTSALGKERFSAHEFGKCRK
jgi:hypothetical protein